MRLRDDLLAAAQGMAGSGSVGDASQDALEPPRRSRRDRLVEGLARLGKRGSPRGGEKTGPNPTDRGKSGSKRHLLVDRGGVPLAVRHTAANVHDSRMLEAMLDAVSPIRRARARPGRPRKRPEKLHADKGYDFSRCREALRQRGIIPRIGRRGLDSSSRLGRHRWVVERTLAWLNRYRRLKVRYERRADVHQAFLSLGCALVCWNFVQRFCSVC
jgi:IS5 family transposase